MKNQGVFVTRIVMLALAAFMLTYMSYHVYHAFYTAIGTTTAVLMETEHSLRVSGVVTRDERQLVLPDGNLQLVVSDGDKVASGETIAVTYSDPGAKDAYSRISELETQISQLEYISRRSDVVSSARAYDNEISARLIGIMEAVDNNDMIEAQSESLEFKTALFKRAYTFDRSLDLVPVISALKAEAEELKSRTRLVSSEFKAPGGGVFSSLTDGKENVWRPEALKGMTPGEFTALAEAGAELPGGNVCKLVSGIEWFVSAVVSDEDRELLAVGKNVTVRISDASPFTLTMRVHSLSESENGKRLVTLSSKKYLPFSLDLRNVTADLIFNTYSGLRVPKNAVEIDEDGRYYVYCVVTNQIVKKYITLISAVERENYYLAEYDPSGRNTLLPSDEIVVSGKNLYDGKVLAG